MKTQEPKFCENIYKKDESKTLSINIEMAIIHFQDRLADAAIVSVQCFFNLMHFFLPTFFLKIPVQFGKDRFSPFDSISYFVVDGVLSYYITGL